MAKRNKLKDYRSETGKPTIETALKPQPKKVVKRGNSDHRVAPINHDAAL